MHQLQKKQQLESRQLRRKAWWVGILLLTILILTALSLAACVGTVAEDQASAEGDPMAAANSLPPAPTVGHPAPEFSLLTLDGDEIRLSELRGKPVIINFWASWCGPCRLEMPDLQATHLEQGDGLTVLGVNLTERDSNLDEVAGFIEELGVTFPIVLDTEGEVADLYRVRGQPASIFVDADGVVSTVFYGIVNEQFIQDRISELVES